MPRGHPDEDVKQAYESGGQGRGFRADVYMGVIGPQQMKRGDRETF